MKFTFLFLLYSTWLTKNLYGPAYTDPASSPEAGRITKVIVKSVDFEMTTWGRISCEAFDKQFPTANTTLIVDRSTLDALDRRLSAGFLPAKNMTLDTRAKITIFYKDSTKATLCMGGSGMEYNGSLVKFDKEVSRLLGILTY